MITYIRLLLQKRRSALGMSQTELAKRSGVSQAQISKVEAGSQDIKLGPFIKILTALKLKLVITEGRPVKQSLKIR